MSVILAALMCVAFASMFVSIYRSGKAPIWFIEIDRESEPLVYFITAILVSFAAAFVVYAILQPFGV